MWRIFEGKAEKYDEWYEVNREIFEREVGCIERLIEGRNIAEIGVGTGRFAEKLKVRIGVDASLDMLRIAKKRGVKELVRGDAHNLPFKDSTFDCLLFIVTLCFLDNPTKALNEANRVLKLNGKLIAAIVPKDSELGRRYIEKAKQGHRFYSRAKFYTLEEVKNMLEGAGFEVIDLRSVKIVSELDFVCIKAVKG
ncbi:SAM-dependent methyltransferase [Archaeoglobales archaeon]|nr:MAG: SAM-dependent methyltransferase [Archaeoglobales archaeon]